MPSEVRVLVVVNFDVKVSLNQVFESVTTSQDCSVLSNIIFVVSANIEFAIAPREVSESGSACSVLENPVHPIIHQVDRLHSSLSVSSPNIIHGGILASIIVNTLSKINS